MQAIPSRGSLSSLHGLSSLTYTYLSFTASWSSSCNSYSRRSPIGFCSIGSLGLSSLWSSAIMHSEPRKKGGFLPCRLKCPMWTFAFRKRRGSRYGSSSTPYPVSPCPLASSQCQTGRKRSSTRWKRSRPTWHKRCIRRWNRHRPIHCRAASEHAVLTQGQAGE